MSVKPASAQQAGAVMSPVHQEETAVDASPAVLRLARHRNYRLTTAF